MGMYVLRWGSDNGAVGAGLPVRVMAMAVIREESTMLDPIEKTPPP